MASRATEPAAGYFRRVARFERGDEFIEAWLEGDTLMTRRGRKGIDDPPRVSALADGGAPRSRTRNSDDPARVTAGEAHIRYQQLQSECLRDGWQRVRDPDREASVDGEPRESALDRALHANPRDRAAAVVYVDWLQQRGHPRGSLIALQDRGRTIDAELLLRREAQVLLGPLAGRSNLTLRWERGFIRAARIVDLDAMVLARSALRRQGFSCAVRLGIPRILACEEDDPDEVLWELLRHPSARFLRDLQLHFRAGSVAGIPCLLDDVLVRHPPPRPPLSRLVLDLRDAEASLRGLDEAYPDLRVLRIGRLRALDLGELRLPRLRRLEIRAPMRRAALSAVLDRTWPELSELALRVSNGRWGDSRTTVYFFSECECTASDLVPLIDGTVRLPRLRALRLWDAPFADELCAVLARSPLAPTLEVLDLSGGELTDRGAAALMAARERFVRLQEVIVEHCMLSDAARAGLRQGYARR